MGECFLVRRGGGNNTSDATITPSKVLEGEIGYGKDGKVIGAIPIKSAQIYTPSTADQIISAEQYLGGAQTIKGDANLIPANIPKGMTIFDITGEMESSTEITGQGEASGICYEAISKGNLLTTRRYFGFGTPVQIANPSVLPGNTARCVDYTSDGIYMAVGYQVVSPYLNIYKWDGSAYIKLANPTGGLPSGAVYGVAFSPDKEHLAVAMMGSPYFAIYKRNGDVFTKLANPSVMPTSDCYSVKYSPDGLYLFVGCLSTPYINIYKRSGDTYTKLANPSTLPTGQVNDIVSSPDMIHLFVAHRTTPFFTIYKRNVDVFSKLANPGVLPTSDGSGVDITNDGSLVAISQNNTRYVLIYTKSGDVITKLPDTIMLPGSGSYSCVRFSGDDKYIITTHSATPFLTIYRREGTDFIKEDGPSVLPPGNALFAAYNPIQPHLAVVGVNEPYITIYKADILGDYLHKYLGFTDFYYKNYINFGYANEDGIIDDVIDITTLPMK